MMSSSKKSTLIEEHIASTPYPIRLQDYGLNIFKTISSKSALKKVIKKQLIWVDDNIASTATMITGGEIIKLHQVEEILNKREFKLKLALIFEDDFLALIYKPAGILVSGNAFKTIANALVPNLKKSNQADATTPKPAHRLDFPTTGLLLVGKTSKSISTLNALFEHKKIIKTYYAVTIGEMKEEQTITIPIENKKAASNCTVIATVVSKKFTRLNLVKLEPKTGRRHQLRKHLSAIGNPILGDSDYGIKGKISKGKGLYLHAFSLEFIHPMTKEQLYFESALPQKFRKLFGEQTH